MLVTPWLGPQPDVHIMSVDEPGSAACETRLCRNRFLRLAWMIGKPSLLTGQRGQGMRIYLANLRDDMLFEKPFPEGEDKDLSLWQVLLHVVTMAPIPRQLLRALSDLGSRRLHRITFSTCMTICDAKERITRMFFYFFP